MVVPDADGQQPQTDAADQTAPGASQQNAVDVAWHARRLRLIAAAAPFEVPTVTGESDGVLVTSPPSGTPADQPDQHPDPDDLIVAVGAGLRTLHGLDVSPFLVDDQDQPVVAGWELVAQRCRIAVENRSVRPAELPEPYSRYSAEQLLEMCLDGFSGFADDNIDTVLCHGHPVLAQFLASNGSFSGFASLTDVTVADRHYDLAVLHQSVQQVLGPEAVFRLYESYGQDPKLAKLEHYVLVSHLLGTAPVQVIT